MLQAIFHPVQVHDHQIRVFFVRALMVHSFAILIGNILAGNIVREAIVSFLFPDLYWNIASSVFICFDCSGLGRPVLRMMAIVSLPRLSVCAGQGAVRPPASAAPLQEHHRPEREVRWRPLTASCSRAAFRHADAAYSSGMKTRSPAHKMALVLFYFYFILFFWFVHVIICNRADTQKLTSSSQMISSVQIMEFIGKKCRIKCIIKCNIRLFLSYLSHVSQQCWRDGADRMQHVQPVINAVCFTTITIFMGNLWHVSQITSLCF